jgi:glucose/arabinose dehydrogenase
MKIPFGKLFAVISVTVAAGAAFFITSCGELGGVVEKKLQTDGGGEKAGRGGAGIVPPTPGDITLPAGYKAEVVATGFTFPVNVTFDDANRPVVTESGYAYGEKYAPARLIRVELGGGKTVIAEGGNQPWTGAAYYNGAFYVSQGGYPGKIARVSAGGGTSIVLDGIPSKGDHHVDQPVVGPDGWIYFGVGSITNSGVVGEDNFYYGWLTARPKMHDIPAHDITLVGENFSSQPVMPPAPIPLVSTGAYVPFGTQTQAGQVIKGETLCTSSIMRVRPGGGTPEVVAWGLRNPFALAFTPGGELYTTEQGYDNRGSRPIEHAPDCLWRVRRGTWYGFPDFAGGMPVTDARFRANGKPPLQFLLAHHPGTPPSPSARFEPHSGAMGLDFSRSSSFGYVGDAFVAQFGDATPVTGVVQAPAGFRIVRVSGGRISTFASNRAAAPGPASRVGGGGLERPIDVQFDRTGRAMYVVDFGVMTIPAIPNPHRATGVLWRITR